MTLRTRSLIAASWLACHLPEGPLVRLAELSGEAWYRLAPERAAQARRNLRRVCRSLAADGRGTPAARIAADDPRALERLVRAAFRHSARYYLEVARTPCLTARGDRAPAGRRDARDRGRGLRCRPAGHLRRPPLRRDRAAGAVPASRVGGAVAPMETVADAALQDFFVRTRGAAGVRIVGLREARRELLNALRDGTSVGLVGDRDLTGGGLPIPLFGAPADLPLGPAMLAVESGAPLYVVGVRRTTRTRYRGGIEAVPVPADGTRRERVTAAMTALAGAFERTVATAPEQWWAVFFPIWPDLEAAHA